MSDPTLLLEKLEQIEDALNKIKRRFASIHSPDDLKKQTKIPPTAKIQ